MLAPAPSSIHCMLWCCCCNTPKQGCCCYNTPKKGFVRALLISPPAALSTSMLTLSRGNTRAPPSSCTVTQSHVTRQQTTQQSGLQLWQGSCNKLSVVAVSCTLASMQHQAINDTTFLCHQTADCKELPCVQPHHQLDPAHHAQLQTTYMRTEFAPAPPPTTTTITTLITYLTCHTWKPSSLKKSIAPCTAATRVWNAALPVLMDLNLSSSGERATLPMYLIMVLTHVLKASSLEAVFFMDTSCPRSFSITVGSHNHAAARDRGSHDSKNQSGIQWEAATDNGQYQSVMQRQDLEVQRHLPDTQAP